MNNVRSTHVHYTYADRPAINNNASKVSYNGGKGGVQAQPTAQQRQVSNARHTQPTLVQQNTIKTQRITSAKSGTGASSNPQIKAEKQTQLASQNTHATESHKTAVKPQSHSQTHAQSPAHSDKSQAH